MMEEVAIIADSRGKGYGFAKGVIHRTVAGESLSSLFDDEKI